MPSIIKNFHNFDNYGTRTVPKAFTKLKILAFGNVLRSGTLSSEGGVPLLFIYRSDVGVALIFLRRASI